MKKGKKYVNICGIFYNLTKQKQTNSQRSLYVGTAPGSSNSP
jgi:hypothetical protein